MSGITFQNVGKFDTRKKIKVTYLCVCPLYLCLLSVDKVAAQPVLFADVVSKYVSYWDVSLEQQLFK